MNGASIASQSGGRPGFAGAALSGLARDASAYSCESVADSLPVAASIRRILMPLQKLPKLSQGWPLSSNTMLGSMALKSSDSVDFSTRPSSFQRYLGLFGSSVSLVARAMPEVFTPKAE